ncbi:MAG: hypothetical protein JWP78_316 [Mucilaginibacter sp.]|nr:hypothetical protein [Mucilaginibacter sp.]
MKKFLLVLFVALAAVSACKKDTSTYVNVNTADVSEINAQLKGSWVFPVKTLTVVDSTGKALLPAQNLSGAALEFDGYSKVTIKPDPQTVLHGTYTVSTSKGNIYVEIVYPDATATSYLVTSLNGQTLTLTTTAPYTYIYSMSGELLTTVAVTSTVLQKLSSADVTGGLVRVSVKNDSMFSVKVYVTHTGGGAILVDSLSHTSKSYDLAFVAKSGDHLKVDVLGGFLRTSINAYFNGLPIPGDISITNGETVTTSGWNVLFP